MVHVYMGHVYSGDILEIESIKKPTGPDTNNIPIGGNQNGDMIGLSAAYTVRGVALRLRICP
jgi:hypothetical protein